MMPIMSHVDAIYQNGVFKPLGEVGLRENERVRLSIEAMGRQDILGWLARVQEHRAQIIAKKGYFPDSALDIAEDRLRDI
jgi:predicted DNA-binding antitoxin AbrB/MazE fold protein